MLQYMPDKLRNILNTTDYAMHLTLLQVTSVFLISMLHGRFNAAFKLRSISHVREKQIRMNSDFVDQYEEVQTYGFNECVRILLALYVLTASTAGGLPPSVVAL